MPPEDNAAPVTTENATPEAGAEGAAPAAAPVDWKTGLDPELRAMPSLEKFKSPNDLVKSYNELEKLIGKEKVVIPNEKSKPEEVKAFYQKLGVPVKPDGYKIPKIEGVEPNKEMANVFLKIAHEANLSQKQVETLYKYELDRIVAAKKQQEADKVAQTEKAETTLRQEWGRAYDEKLSTANKVLANFATQEELRVIQEKAGSDPAMVRFLAKVGAALSESGFHGIRETHATMTPEMARSEIHNMMSDPKHPVNVKTHPEHEAAINRLLDLQRMAHVG